MLRFRDSLFVLALAPGCNQVYGLEPTKLRDDVDAMGLPDRDRDGIPDPEDGCISAGADLTADSDVDGAINMEDLCPFYFSESADADADNVYDECDPLPMLGGDRRRCVMAFQSPTINSELWAPRTGESSTWNLLGTTGLTGQGSGALVAEERFEGPVTTSYTLAIAPVVPPTTTSAVTLWLRTRETSAASDVGCELRGDGTSSRLKILGSTPVASVQIARPVGSAAQLQATISPTAPSGRANVRCRVHVANTFMFPTVSAEVALPAGNLAFAVDGAAWRFVGLMIMDRDDSPAL